MRKMRTPTNSQREVSFRENLVTSDKESDSNRTVSRRNGTKVESQMRISFYKPLKKNL